MLIKRRTALLASAFLVLIGGTGHASIVEVKVPFPFQVRGQMLPAGQYRVTSNADGVVEILGERGTRAAMYAMAIPARGQDPEGDKPTLTFKREEKNYRLTSIWASETDGRTITGTK
jgi:hypothetical protein